MPIYCNNIDEHIYILMRILCSYEIIWFQIKFIHKNLKYFYFCEFLSFPKLISANIYKK